MRITEVVPTWPCPVLGKMLLCDEGVGDCREAEYGALEPVGYGPACAIVEFFKPSISAKIYWALSRYLCEPHATYPTTIDDHADDRSVDTQ